MAKVVTGIKFKDSIEVTEVTDRRLVRHRFSAQVNAHEGPHGTGIVQGNCLPKSAQPKAKQALHNIWQAETQADAERAFDLFIKTYEPKYPKAAVCLHKDREELMAFYDFPAQHWQSIRTSNPIESTFGTIRHRTKRSKGCLSRDGMLHMMFKLGLCAEKKWRRLRGFDYLAKVVTGIKFKDGVEVTEVDQVAA